MLKFLIFLTLAVSSNIMLAQDLTLAVSSNFAKPIQSISFKFTQETGVKVNYSLGATGALYSQIKSGAPYDVFLSADASTPRKLITEGLGIASSNFTYARGQLILWSKDPTLVDNKGLVLQSGRFKSIALANPKLAPYGQAAQETLEHLGLGKAIKSKMILTDNITQVFQYVSSQNIPLGFIAGSQLPKDESGSAGSFWRVPSSLHAPIEQDALLLTKGAQHATALQFLQFLKRQDIKVLIRSSGYDI